MSAEACREVAFAKGEYEFDYGDAHVTVRVPRDVYADEIGASSAMLARACAEREGVEKDAA